MLPSTTCCFHDRALLVILGCRYVAFPWVASFRCQNQVLLPRLVVEKTSPASSPRIRTRLWHFLPAPFLFFKYCIQVSAGSLLPLLHSALPASFTHLDFANNRAITVNSHLPFTGDLFT